MQPQPDLERIIICHIIVKENKIDKIHTRVKNLNKFIEESDAEEVSEYISLDDS